MGTRQHDYPTNFSSTYSAVGKNWVRTNITSIPPISQPRTAAPEQETIWDNDLVVIFSSIVLFICFCMCTKSRIPDERYRRGEQIRESARRALQEKNARFEDPELRQQLIDQSLVKKVRMQ